MANTRALVKRRKAIRNIRKITRTMELIATARFKKAFDRATEAEAYTRKIAELAADLSASATRRQASACSRNVRQVKNSPASGDHLQPRPVRRLQRAHPPRSARHRSQAELKQQGITLHLELSGKRAITYFRFQRIPAEATYTQFEDKPRFEEVDELANRYIAAYIAGKIDRVEVAYMKFLNAARQTPVVETLLAACPQSRRAWPARLPPLSEASSTSSLPSAKGHPGRDPADVVQGAAVQVLPRRRGERADRPPRGHEGRHRERRRHDQRPDADSTTAPGRRRLPRKSPKSSAARRR